MFDLVVQCFVIALAPLAVGLAWRPAVELVRGITSTPDLGEGDSGWRGHD